MSLPETMTFVEGDLLIVRNQDTASHQLGPVWVPAQSSGVLEDGHRQHLFLRLLVFEGPGVGGQGLERLTLGMRIQGALMIGLPSAVMIALYSFLIFPLKSKRRVARWRPRVTARTYPPVTFADARRLLLTPRWIFATLVVVAGVLGMVRLGFWQLERLDWRRSLNAQVAAVQRCPLNLNEGIACRR